ncbi:hypothetical protein KIN20_034159 [Parelaphostrongylus tenuis]|uniref:Lipoprotein n=1 Tax=Parelaphostrongylus tenuis TaxID=148309 RepID=A0AAD5WJG6_PARTN|nr:hypothetical protein KIN20_034159 [Parelaphostrongylus tenuis]
MRILTSRARLPPEFFMILLLATTVVTLSGCGVIPAGQASARAFNVTVITNLPVAMAYSTAPDVQAKVRGIAISEGAAQAFVMRLVMQTARSALLPDGVISAILGQLEIKITYAPLQCLKFTRDPTKVNGMPPF